MNQYNRPIGRIMKIEGISVRIELTENEYANKLTVFMGNNDYIISINKLIYSELPNGKKIIARIKEITDRNIFEKENIFATPFNKILVDADLIGIYDDFLKKFDTGINHFPIIGSEVFPIEEQIYQAVLRIDSDWRLEVGTSFNDSKLTVAADPDILFGKHLGVFGNTGTGKTCTIASLIQGLKKRTFNNRDNSIPKLRPKIIIFDSNNEYYRAFDTGDFKIRTVKKEELKLPHYYLSFSEYVKFLGASQGVQAPVLKEAIHKLKNEENDRFRFSDLPGTIEEILKEKSREGNSQNPNGERISYSQWYGWNSTLINRIQRVIEDKNLINILDSDSNTVFDILESDDEIVLIQADFDKSELDIVIYLFSKLVYQWSVENRDKENRKNIVLLFEEAHRFINEEDADEYRLGNYYIERLAREGRKFGIGLIISSQRPSELSRTVVSQCNSFIIHRITNKSDLDVINRILSTQSKDLISIIPGLEKQYAIVIGEAFGYSDVIKVFDAIPTPRSDDPKVIYSWRKKVEISTEHNINGKDKWDEFIEGIIHESQKKKKEK